MRCNIDVALQYHDHVLGGIKSGTKAMVQEFKSSFSNQDILHAGGIVRNRVTPNSFSNMTRRTASCVSARRHAPSFADFIQR